MKIFHTFLIVLMSINLLPSNIKAEDNSFVVYDNNSGFSETFSTLNEANRFYNSNLDEYDNLILKENDVVLKMEYGIVEFKSDEACSLSVSYYSSLKKEDDLINGCYGIDAAYTGSSNDLSQVYFVLSGDRGYTSIDNVILHPYEELETRISSYINSDHFIHNIMSQLNYEFYTYSIELDDRLDIKEGEYYSYDGHYFYDDFYQMIDDYRNNTYENAVNENPYYNYYQYLPHRSLTNYTYEDINDYLTDTLGMNGRLYHYDDINQDNAADEINRSQLYDATSYFFENQYIYGTNAMMLLGSAIYESSYGRSLNSYQGNNLYITAAYEGEEGKEKSKYDSVADSIYSHSKYFISSRYSNHLRNDYRGTFYGNKLSGINVNYSIDPYYGEKSASQYYQLDSLLGYKDKDNYAIGIIKDRKSTYLYEDQELDYRKFTLSDIAELSLVILEENDNSYKVSVDHSFNDDYRYDFTGSVAYVSKDVFSEILNENKIHDYELESVHYDFDGGLLHEYEEIDILCNGDAYVRPYKSHYEFKGFDENNVAQYLYIEAIDLIEKNDNPVELYQNIDLSNYRLRVFYEDNTYEDKELNSDMITSFDSSSPGRAILVINYNDVIRECEIQVSEELYNIRNEIREAIEKEDYQKVKENVSLISYPFTFDEIRKIDAYLREANNRNYVIEDHTDRYDVSLSGLDLAISDMNSLDIFGDTYYAIIRLIPYYDNIILKRYGEGYGFDIVEGINLSFRFNFEDVEIQAPVIVQLNLEGKQNDLVYSVYHLSKDGDVIKVRTTQSENYIQYMATESGSYLVLSRPSINTFDIDDTSEDLNYDNMGVDNHRINFILFLIVIITLSGIIGIVLYYVLEDRNNKLWNDFRKSLPTLGSVQEEKPKN